MANRYSLEATFNLIDKATKPLDKITGTANITGEAIKKSYVKAQKSVDEFGKKLAKIPGYLSKAALAAAGAATAAAGAFVVQGVKGAVEFQKSMEKVGAQANLTGEQIAAFSSDLIKLSNNTGSAVSDLASAQLHAISNGVKVADSVQFLEVATKAANGGFTDTTTVINSLTSVLKSYGLEASSASKISDQMMAAARAGGVSFADMSTKLERVIPVAAKFGVTTDELFASVATLTSQGVPVADAAKQIKSALEKGGKQGLFKVTQGEKFNEMLKQVTASTGATEAAFNRVDKTLGEQWGSTLNKIKNTGLKIGMALLPAFQKIIDKVSIFVDKFASVDFSPFIAQIETALDRILGSIDFNKLAEGIGSFFTHISKITNCVISFIELIWKLRTPILILTGTIKIINGLMFAWALVDKIKNATAIKLIVAIVKKCAAFIALKAQIIAAKIATVAYAVAQKAAAIAGQIAAAAQWALNAAMSANPIGLIIIGVVALIAIIILLVKNWDKVSAALKKAFEAIGGFFVKIWEGIKSFFGKVVEFVKNNALNILNVILTILFFPAGVIMAVVRLIIKHWEKIKEVLGKAGEFIKGVFNKAKEGAGKAWEGMKNGASKAMEGIKGAAGKAGGWLKANWKTVAVGMVNPYAGGLKYLYDHNEKFRNACDAVFGKIKDIAGKVWDKMPDGLKDVFLKIKGIMDSAVEKIKGIWNGVKEFFTGLWEAIKEGPAAVFDYLKNAFFGLFDSIKEKFFGFINIIKDGWNTVKGFFGGIGDFFSGNKKTNVAPQVNSIVPPAVSQTTTQTAGVAANIPAYNMPGYNNASNRNNQTITAAATPATRPMTTAEQHIYRETTNRDQVDIAVRAEQGTRARVTRPPRSPNVKVASSGGNG